MKRNWKILYSNYSGLEKKAIELISAEVGKYILRDKGVYTLHTLAVEPITERIENNIIVIGKYDDNVLMQKYIKKDEVPSSGYCVKVIPNPDDENLKIALITAFEPINVFYAAVDFVDNYLPSAAVISGGLRTPAETFDKILPDYFYTSSPQTEKRSIFTWGHPINNYRRYIDNIARLKINQLIIWNDFLPVNASDVVSYAHEYEIEVIWGFAWGWTTNCNNTEIIENLDKIKSDIVDKFQNTYNGAGDGIYFQSFTETHEERLAGRLIADVVTDFVNEVSDELYKINPDIHIQFGLHAMSVEKHIEFIANVDERVEILWEDCGSFPYNYMPELGSDEDYEKTLEFTHKIINLRERGLTGLVYKGMMTMDWTKFEHQSGPYIMGMASEELIEDDISMLTPIWKYFQSEWMNNGKRVWDFTRKICAETGTNLNLCIAGALDGAIWFPQALCAEIMWNSSESYETILDRVSKKSCVKFV